MKICTFLAALLALCNWTFVMSSKALAHGGTDLAVLDCEDEDGDDDSARAVLKCDCEDEEEGDDAERAVLDCDDEEGDKDNATLDCEDEDQDDGAAIVLDCHDDDEQGEE